MLKKDINSVTFVHDTWNLIRDAVKYETSTVFFDYIDAHIVYAQAYISSEAGEFDVALKNVDQMDGALVRLYQSIREVAPRYTDNREVLLSNFDDFEEILEAYLLQDFGANQWMCDQLNPDYFG